MLNNKGATAFEYIVSLGVVCVYALMGYVVLHFIVKFW
jgi:hypothetical protein